MDIFVLSRKPSAKAQTEIEEDIVYMTKKIIFTAPIGTLFLIKIFLSFSFKIFFSHKIFDLVRVSLYFLDFVSYNRN